MVTKITKKEYLEKIINYGVRRLGFVPLSVQRDKVFLKAVLQHDPEVLLFLPEKLLTQDNFWNTNPKKRYLLLKSDIAKSVPAKMIEWIVDEKSSVVGMDFFKSEFVQFKDLTEDAKMKLGLSFLIEGRQPPLYVSGYIDGFTIKSKEDLKTYKGNLILRDMVVKILDEGNSLSSNESNSSCDDVIGSYKI